MQYVQDSRIKGEGERERPLALSLPRLDGWLVVAGGTKRGADDVMWRMGIENWGCSPSALLCCIDKTFLGMSGIGVATPWDDCPYVHTSVLELIGFS